MGLSGLGGLAQGEYDCFALGPCSSCHGERQIREDALAGVEWEHRDLDGQQWSSRGDEGKREAAEHRKEVCFCPEECGKVIHPLQHGLRQALCREPELYGWVDRKRHHKAACLGPPTHSLPEARCQPWQRCVVSACLPLSDGDQRC